MPEAVQFVRDVVGESPLEAAAVALGLVNILLLIRRSVWNYPFGIAMVSLYALIFFEAKLYGNSGLQIFFLVVQIYGWRHWLKWRGADSRVIVDRLAPAAAIAYAASAALGAVVLGAAMDRLTDSAHPYWDAAVTVLSVIAQILLVRRRVENWIVWIAVDVLAIALFWAQDLRATSALYALFLALATAGLFSWRRALGKKAPA